MSTVAKPDKTDVIFLDVHVTRFVDVVQQKVDHLDQIRVVVGQLLRENCVRLAWRLGWWEYLGS